jgi:hypothetical protein
MTEMSPEFSFVEYHTYEIHDNGSIVGPAMPPESVSLGRDYNRYVYAFADMAGMFPGAVWTHAQTFRLWDAASPQFRLESPRISSPEEGKPGLTDDPAEWNGSLQGVQLARSINAQAQDIKYFFLVTRWPLEKKTIAEVARLGPKNLLPASLPVGELSIDGKHQQLISTEGGKITFVARDTPSNTSGYPGMFASVQRYVCVVDPLAIGEHLAATLDANMTNLARFVDPNSAVDAKAKKVTELRLARHAVASQIDLLRKGGANIDKKLATSPKNGAIPIEPILQAFDPSNRSVAGLGRLLWYRDRTARVLREWMTSPLWNLLCKDARASAQRAKDYYARYLTPALFCMDPLARTPEGADYFEELYKKCLPARAARVAPMNSLEYIAQEFVFTEPRGGGNWEEPVAVSVARSLWAFYIDIAPTIAKYANTVQNASEILPNSPPQTTAQIQPQTPIGFSVRRWANHIRTNFGLGEDVTVTVTPNSVNFESAGKMKSFNAPAIEVTWNHKSWVQKLGAKGPGAEAFNLGLNVVGVVFSTGSFVEAVQTGRNRDTAFLKTASAYMSLGQSGYVQELFKKIGTLGASKTGLAAVKLVGLGGAVLGAIASLKEAADLQKDLGETAAAWTVGVSGVGTALIAGWGAAAGIFPKLISAPGGWWVVGAAALAVGGAVIVWAIKDTDIQDMVEHSFVGEYPAWDHVAPGMSLCATNRFTDWAGAKDDLALLEAQRLAFLNIIWAFRVQGQAMIGEFPCIQITPQCLFPGSTLEASVEATWIDSVGAIGQKFNGLAHLHISHDKSMSVVSVDGQKFETKSIGPQLRPVICAVAGGGNRTVEWIVAPEAAIRAQQGNLLLQSMTVKMRLWITGIHATATPNLKQPPSAVPAPRGKDLFQFLTYELVQAGPSTIQLNPQVPILTPIGLRGGINSTEVWSTSAYDPP